MEVFVVSCMSWVSSNALRSSMWLTSLAPCRGGQVVGLSPNIRIYRYTPSQFFDAHCTCQPSHDKPFSERLQLRRSPVSDSVTLSYH